MLGFMRERQWQRRTGNTRLLHYAVLVFTAIFALRVSQLASFGSSNAARRSSRMHTTGSDHSEQNDQPVVSIVARATGELGNHLRKIVHAKTFEIVAREDFRLRTRILVRMGDGANKFLVTQRTIMGCFTNISKHIDYGSNVRTMKEEQETRLKQQQEWLGPELAEVFNVRGPPSHTPPNREQIRDKLAIVRRVVDGMIESNGNTTKMCSQSIDLSNGEEKLVEYTCLPPDVPYSGSTFTLPFLMVFDSGAYEGIDLFYDQIRDFLHYDESGVVLPEGHACCSQLPNPDESVFHFRNFYSEFGGYEPGMFRELDPNRTATELLHDLPSGSRVAIITRFNNERAQSYVKAMESHGFSARIVSGQQGYQDFCFLKHAQKPIFSVARSTFAFFATIIANNRSLPSYRYTIKHSEALDGGLDYQWTHPELRDRVHFQLYDPRG